jgi:hypothetical protein
MFVRIYETVLELQELLVLLLRFKSGTGTNSKPGFIPIRPKSLRPHRLQVSHGHWAGRLSYREVSSPSHAQCITHYLIRESITPFQQGHLASCADFLKQLLCAGS